MAGQISTAIAARFITSPQLWGNYTIIWIGRNNLVQATILADIASIVSRLPHTRYVVMAIVNDESEPSGSSIYNNIVAINAAISAAYPGHYLDIRSQLVASYNSGNGADVADHASDIPPYSLRAQVSSGTLAAALTNTTSCPVLSGPASFVGDIIAVDSEYIVVNSFTGNTVNTCTRGYGSTAATHANAAAYTLADYLHFGASGHSVIASRLATFINANDPVAGSYSSTFTTDQWNNTVIGGAALNSNSGGTQNTAIGAYSLLRNSTGNQNTSVGDHAMFFNTTGNGSSAYGFQSMFYNTTGGNNAAFGYYSLLSNTVGGFNTALGYSSMYANTTGVGNTASGYASLYSNTTGQYNSASGYSSMSLNTTGSNNDGLGTQTLGNNTTGGNNDAVGYQALNRNTVASNNSAFGSQALFFNTTGASNAASGYQALYSNATGGSNSAFGAVALHSNTTSSFSTAIGNSALYNSTGQQNTAIGVNALIGNTTGTNNVGVGLSAGSGSSSNTTGSNNTFVGYKSVPGSATQRDHMTVLGADAIGDCSSCVVLGRSADTVQIPSGLVQANLIYSAAGTPLPACNAAAKGVLAVVGDATTPTYLGTYVSGGAVLTPVACNGTGWVTY